MLKASSETIADRLHADLSALAITARMQFAATKNPKWSIVIAAIDHASDKIVPLMDEKSQKAIKKQD